MAGITIADAEVKVTASGSGVVDEVVRDIDSGGGRAGASGQGLGRQIFGGVMAGWAAIGGISAVTGFFTGAVSGASDLNETLSKTEAIFGANTSAVTTWASTSATTVGMSQQAALAAASSFGDMFTQIGFTGDAAAAMSTEVVQAAADLGSFSNLDTADVADRMSAAFRGEYDSLQAVIPNINAARVESEALAMTGKDTAASLTAQERAAAVLAIVQQDGARAMGDFARTSDGAANAARIATARFEDQQTALGQQLLPVWVGFLGFLNDTAIPAFSTLVTWLSTNADTVLMLAGVVGGAVIAYGLITTAMGIHAAFTAASAAATGGMTFAQWALNAALSANPIGLVVTLIAVLVGAIIWVATQTTFFQDTWVAMTTWIGQAWSAVVAWVTAVFTSFGAWLTAAGNNIAVWWNGLWAGIGAWIVSVWTAIVTGVTAFFTGLWATILGIGTAIAGWWNGLWASIGAWIVSVWTTIVAGVTLYVNLVRTVITAVFTAVSSWWNGLWTGIGNFVRSVWTGIVSGVTGYVNGVRSVITSVINAVSSTWSSVWNGIKSFFTSTWNSIMGVVNTVSGVFGRAFSAAAGAIRSAFSGVVGVIRGVVNGVIGVVNGAIRGVNGALGTVGAAFGINIAVPTIPLLARGSNNAPDTFIAGENGPELITGARGSTVTPYSQTRDRLANMGRGDTIVRIGQVVLDASNVEDFMRIVELIKALPEVARAGRGSEGY